VKGASFINTVKSSKMKISINLLSVFICIITILSSSCNVQDSEPDFYDYVPDEGEIWEGKDIGISEEYAVDPAPFTEGLFPCNECHEFLDANPERRELTDMHDDITAIYDHDSENRWCLACHDLDNRNYLRLASGELLDFNESYKLCGQCHGNKLRDWKVGVHGKRKGMWNGQKEYLLCVHCHNPHSPRFMLLTPEPPPVMHITHQDSMN